MIFINKNILTKKWCRFCLLTPLERGGGRRLRVEHGEGVVRRQRGLAQRRDEGVARRAQAQLAAQVGVRLLSLEDRLRGALVCRGVQQQGEGGENPAPRGRDELHVQALRVWWGAEKQFVVSV